MNRRIFRKTRRNRAVSSTEWIIVVSVIAIASIGVVTFFGRRILNHFKGASKGLDTGQAVTADATMEKLGTAVPDAPTGPASVDPGGIQGSGSVGGTNMPDVKARITDVMPVFDQGSLAWVPSEILNNMTQIDHSDDTGYDRERCVMASALAARILAGPHAVEKLLKDLKKRVKNGTVTNYKDEDNYVSVGNYPKDTYLKLLGKVQRRLRSRTLDYGDLGMIQDLMFEAYGNVHKFGADYKAIMKVAQLGGAKDPSGTALGGVNSSNNTGEHVKTSSGLKTRIESLKKGESRTVVIDRFPPPGGDHAIMVGKDRFGKPYIYDPWPKGKKGGQQPSQIFYKSEDSAQYKKYLKKYKPPKGFEVYSPAKY